MKTYVSICKKCGNEFEHPYYNMKICIACAITRKNNIRHHAKKIQNHISKCIYCNEEFKHADVKAKKCPKCLEQIEQYCGCGCGILVKKARFRMKLNPYYYNHQNAGKTYDEIYGAGAPACGFKSGVENPMSNPACLRKLKSSVKKRDIFLDGIAFSNNYELNTYIWLKHCYGTEFTIQYEDIIQFHDGTRGIPDFIIYDKNHEPIKFVEVSGYASVYEKSRSRNLSKLYKYIKDYPNTEILFISNQRLLTLYEFPTEVITLNYNIIKYHVQNNKRI